MTTAESVRTAVQAFFKDSLRPVLFAGAGISVRAGLPTWAQFLTALAEQARPRDPLTRHLNDTFSRLRHFAGIVACRIAVRVLRYNQLRSSPLGRICPT